MFYVYEWYIVETGEIIYVGKGTRRRYKVTKHNRFFNEMIKRFVCDSRIVKTFDNENDAFQYEYIRVNELKEKGQCVCNIYNGGFGGSVNWWTDELRNKYSQNNVMKSENQRKRMSEQNPMKNKDIAEKTNGQKRISVIIADKEYISILEASKALEVSTDTIRQWCKKGISSKGIPCRFKDKQSRHYSKHGNQQPSRENDDKSIPEGSTTNE